MLLDLDIVDSRVDIPVSIETIRPDGFPIFPEKDAVRG
jgi:hypothetical protein